MKYFFDTEFIEDGKTIDLISIGIVAEDGREYYAINYNCDFKRANDWVKENVISHLPEQPLPRLYPTPEAFQSSECYKQGWRTRELIADEVKAFCNPEVYGTPEFWGYYADYDWVVFCQLWGTMMQLPQGFPMYCRDIKQWCDQLGNPQLPEQDSKEHHALNDAQWNKQAHRFLEDLVIKTKLSALLKETEEEVRAKILGIDSP